MTPHECTHKKVKEVYFFLFCCGAVFIFFSCQWTRTVSDFTLSHINTSTEHQQLVKQAKFAQLSNVISFAFFV